MSKQKRFIYPNNSRMRIIQSQSFFLIPYVLSYKNGLAEFWGNLLTYGRNKRNCLCCFCSYIFGMIIQIFRLADQRSFQHLFHVCTEIRVEECNFESQHIENNFEIIQSLERWLLEKEKNRVQKKCRKRLALNNEFWWYRRD